MGGQVNLCISLHAPNDEIRRTIMPIAKKYSIGELIDSAKYFFAKTHRRVIFEYSLMCSNGVPLNCTPKDARELAALVRGFPAHINLINLNPLKFDKTAELTPPDKTTAMKFMDTLIKSGVSCTMRKNRGDDIDGACGQLRAFHTRKNCD
jgi:23S rRNA (adenine2503-C2)-methyltransferase